MYSHRIAIGSTIFMVHKYLIILENLIALSLTLNLSHIFQIIVNNSIVKLDKLFRAISDAREHGSDKIS